MTNFGKILIGAGFLIIIGGIIYFYKTPKVPMPIEEQAPIVAEDSIMGCYAVNYNKDVYTLDIASQQGENVSGTLAFKNFEKDSSSGTFSGTYKDSILLADYAFRSEGTDSVMQVIFKKMGDDFVRGYGDVDAATGTRFTDVNNINFDASSPLSVFTRQENCADSASTAPQGKLPASSAPATNPKDIQAHTWVWQKTTMANGSVITPKKVGVFSVTFAADGSISGKTDCNGFGGTYATGSDGVISFGPFMSTLMFCEGSQEAVFSSAVSQSNRYSIDASGNLVLTLKNGAGIMVFNKKSRS